MIIPTALAKSANVVQRGMPGNTLKVSISAPQTTSTWPPKRCVLVQRSSSCMIHGNRMPT